MNSGPPSAIDAAALDSSVNSVVASLAENEGVSPAEVASLRARAAGMIEGMTAEDAAGLRDMHNLTLSMGLHAARSTLGRMVEASPLSRGEKEQAKKEILEISSVRAVGCMEVDFFNAELGRKDKAYLVLDECEADHDLGAQLDKLRRHVAAEKWPEVVRSLSMLVFVARSVYETVARDKADLVRRMCPGAEGVLAYKVDPSNTTLFVDAIPQRIGIFVRMEDEVKNLSPRD